VEAELLTENVTGIVTGFFRSGVNLTKMEILFGRVLRVGDGKN
jgi:hypothetical protein